MSASSWRQFPRLGGVLLAGLVWSDALRAADPAPPPLLVTIQADSVRGENFVGFGIQWDPYSYPPRAAAWQETLRRLDFARPAFFRVMTGGRSYCDGFTNEQPRYVWTQGEPELRRRLGGLLDILDYAQSNQIAVLLGEWSPPGRWGEANVGRPDDPRWARLAADFVTWLRAERHYSVITMFNLMNEPNGNWMWPGGKVDYAAWAAGIKNLRRELDARGWQQVAVVGPDNSWDWDWVDRVAHEMPEAIGQWEMHWYAKDREVLDGAIERVLAAKRKVILERDRAARNKAMFMAECGLLDGKTNGDQQPRVRTFDYGVLMADYAAQVMQAGWMGLCAWDLDDAMHTIGGHPTVPGDRTLKLWGFWNTQGTAMGHPEEEAMRPWFYPWSLMSRLFPPGAALLVVDQPETPQCRVVAARRKADGGISVMVVNDVATARSVRLRIPGGGAYHVSEYHYFENDHPTDARGFAIAQSERGLNSSESLDLALPGRGVVFLEARR